MPKLRIDGIEVKVKAGSTLLQAAETLDISIPTLCRLDGSEPFTSCMVCVVENVETGALLPACSARVEDGLAVVTDSEAVRAARRAALELLLAEHVGDCEAPCTLACPLDIDIAEVIRLVQEGDLEKAAATMRRATAFPELLSRICPARCEKACRRGRHDSAVAIRALMRHVAEMESRSGVQAPSATAVAQPSEKVVAVAQPSQKVVAVAQPSKKVVAVAQPSKKVVAVIGAGAAGLSAAYHLLLAGHSCTLYEAEETAGGSLLRIISETPELAAGFQQDLDFICTLGARLHLNARIGESITLEKVAEGHDAVIISAGEGTQTLNAGSYLDLRNRKTGGGSRSTLKYKTSAAKIYAAGGALNPEITTVDALAQGKAVAVCVDQYLRGQTVSGPVRRFHSHLGRLQEGEILEFLKSAADRTRLIPTGKASTPIPAEEAAAGAAVGAGRCFQCDCGKKDSCHLRSYAETYKVRRRAFSIGRRDRFQRLLQHPTVVYEPGKCIKCGICVRITAEEEEAIGLAFLNRGYQIRIGVPFRELLSRALRHSAQRCVDSCPTGALVFRRGSTRPSQRKDQ
jgi:ferredoxin